MSVTVNATRSPFGEACGSLTRRTFSKSSIVKRRSCASATDTRANKPINQTKKKRFMSYLEKKFLVRESWAHYRISVDGWRNWHTPRCHGCARIEIQPLRLESSR